MKKSDFDINPPFAGDIKDSRLLADYQVAFDAKGKKANTVSIMERVRLFAVVRVGVNTFKRFWKNV
ncbi:MAG: hypothetical protein LBG52_01570 [Candidatus Peribacteria bacterium]|jgi:hypothetical protein|nr:hypothetical protein [Candidatus Peribacteria bacterium]